MLRQVCVAEGLVGGYSQNLHFAIPIEISRIIKLGLYTLYSFCTGMYSRELKSPSE